MPGAGKARYCQVSLALTATWHPRFGAAHTPRRSAFAAGSQAALQHRGRWSSCSNPPASGQRQQTHCTTRGCCGLAMAAGLGFRMTCEKDCLHQRLQQGVWGRAPPPWWAIRAGFPGQTAPGASDQLPMMFLHVLDAPTGFA